MTQKEEECLELVSQSLELNKTLFNDKLNHLSELKNNGCDNKKLNEFETKFKTILNSIENLKKQIQMTQEQK